MRAELLGSRWTQYLTVGGAMVGVRFDNVATGAVALRYFHLDHLGSVAVVTYAGGDVAERNSYDPWGKRRYSDGSDDPSGSLDSVASRGFTGQEHLTEVGLIHFNARLYDPLVGRFTSADSIVPHPGDPQSYNRYAYVRNRPLSATDPSGHYDLVALPPIDVGAPSWSTFNWTSFAASGAANQAYLAAIYGRITGAAYYGASILPFPIGSQLQYQQYLSFLRIYGPQLRAAGFFMTRQPNLTPPPEHAPASTIAAGFAISSYAYAYASGVGRVFHDFIFDPRRYWSDLASSLGRALDACGAICDPSVQASIGDVPGAVILGGIQTAAKIGRTAERVAVAGAEVSGALADLANFRSELGLQPGQGALARLDVGGRKFYGINAHGQDITLSVNAISRTHAEADAFQQAASAESDQAAS
ncbi:RHS repeat-associated core domain-containing protein [Methylosinus trichosporium]|uniref:RHS repeat-associated core domain-containing protein n=1 Tax=Methylosinus trichosporium (strain ATCC 35070 / NCIMB 11131 / UNIQEM 75 / OB3b) TaxID=595536 RepID=A0A2D2D7K1_METT3|nr:RHS repeat-associated core domain-containing protein [Methylosinus trichosporium]ATQ70953.1 RHS repeat-associated core domain-containing protein [Methylosinus trichosporium OB3b]